MRSPRYLARVVARVVSIRRLHGLRHPPPRVCAVGRPWIWRISFPDFHPEIDLDLLERGWHVAHLDCVALLGCDKALAVMARFHEFVCDQWGLAERPAVEAVSRGGLHAYRYTARHPTRVACIYADTPVMNLSSWPAGRADAAGPLADALHYFEFDSM